MLSLSLTCIVAAVEFIFRYLLVVKEYTVGYAGIAAMAAVILIISANNSVFLYLAIDSVDDHCVAFGSLMSDPMWTHNGVRPVYFGANMVGTRSLCQLSHCSFFLLRC